MSNVHERNKLIIHNYTDMPDSIILNHINSVIQCGKISKTRYGDCYCFVTTFQNVVIECDRHKDTYTFKIYNKEN